MQKGSVYLHGHLKCVFYSVIRFCLMYGILIKNVVPVDVLQTQKATLAGTYSLIRLIFIPEMYD